MHRSPISHFIHVKSLSVLIAAAATLLTVSAPAAELKLLFLGDNGHHRPESRFQELAPALEQHGLELHYTDRMEDINPETLSEYDGLMLYANIDRISDAQAKAVLDYVASGKGFIPLHCATFCWRNNPEIVALMGAQFQRHGGRVFTTQIAAPDHPVMRGYGSFTSWDETYIHHLHNETNRTVLEYRVEGNQAEGKDREPWTWVRTHGDGRVFYTAWGHDHRTFSNPGFHNLVERGIRWACGGDPSKVPTFSDPDSFPVPPMTKPRTDVKAFEYVDVGPKIPNYTPGESWGTQGQPLNRMQKPLAASESIRHFVTPEGMAVRLYADEQNFDAKPISMTWDERGRLWICETVDYPNELGSGRDRIRICEDTDGDHRADKFTVFADGLSIPTAITIFRGGAIVQNGTDTIYLKDTDGDDRADMRNVLITNWALGDTHGGVSNFRYGLDNWIWAMQGYNNSTPHVDGGPTQTFRMGFWRFRLTATDPPKVADLEFIRSSNNNTWGLGISEDGLIFGSTANHNPSMFVPIANRYYESVRGWAPSTLGTIADTYKFKPITDKVRQVDQFGGYTAGAGHALYTARTFPRQYWNKTAFVCGPTGHLVGTFVLRREGAGYTSTSPANLLASDDEWCAPIMAEVGPDGAVWVIDWYNYIVQHNPTPQGFQTGKGNAYVSDLRDKKHGRIYRVVPVGTDGDIVHDFASLANASNSELVEALAHESMTWRLQAQRLLIERDARGMFEPLIALAKHPAVDNVGLNVAAIHALHTLHALGDLNLHPEVKRASAATAAINAALRHRSDGVRRNALVVLPHDQYGLERLHTNAQLFADSDLQVRKQAFLTLADMPSSADAARLIVDFFEQSVSDPVLHDAITAAAAAHAAEYLKITGKPETPFDPVIARRVGEHVGRGRPNGRQLAMVMLHISMRDHSFPEAVLDGLNAGLPADFEFQSSDAIDALFLKLLERLPAASKVKAIKLASICRTNALDAHIAHIVDTMLRVIKNDSKPEEQRLQTARELIAFRPNDAKIAAQVAERLTSQSTPATGEQLLAALQGSRAAATGSVIVARVPQLTPKLKSAAIRTVLGRPEWAQALIDGLRARRVDISDLSLDQKQALRSFPNEAVRRQAEQLLARSGGLPNADREKVLRSLLHITKKEGSVEAGRELFRKHCSKCHQHGDIGKTIGPNLTGMSVHPKEELLTHIIDPSRSVEGNFRIYTVVKTDGRIVNGMLASETRTSITLVDTEAKETSIQREDIEELLASKKSVMPDGFEKQMNEQQLTDLLQFLANKGRYVPIPLDRFATAVSTKGLFHDGDNGPDRMIFSDWKPKLFRGIPFVLTDPQGKSRPNIVLLNGPRGTMPPKMPSSVRLPCNTQARMIHFLSGVGGWSFPAHGAKSPSMIVRLQYADGTAEDHPLLNGVHFADYIRRVDVAGSEFAFSLGGQQIRYLSVTPQKPKPIAFIELVKGNDPTSPIVMAVTVER